MTVLEATGIIALLITLISTAGGGVALYLNRHSRGIESLKTLSETVQILSTRVTILETQRDHDAIRIQQLKSLLLICINGLQTLTSQLLKLNITPVWSWPPELNNWLKENNHI